MKKIFCINNNARQNLKLAIIPLAIAISARSTFANEAKISEAFSGQNRQITANNTNASTAKKAFFAGIETFAAVNTSNSTTKTKKSEELGGPEPKNDKKIDNEYLKTLNTDDAIAYIQQVIKNSPKDMNAHVELGNQYANTGVKTNCDKAIGCYEKALELAPDTFPKNWILSLKSTQS